MAKARVEAGVCGFVTDIEISQNGGSRLELKIDSGCPHVRVLAEEYKEVEGIPEVFAPYGESRLFQQAKKHIKHAACPVPTAIIKAIEVSSGLALARDVKIEVKKK